MKKIEKKFKIVTIVGTRPEIIRLSRVISVLDKYCDHTLVHTGQNYDYELNEIFFNELKINKPKFFLSISDKSKSVANNIGNLITSVDEVLNKIQPEALLVLGDTNSCLSVIPAKRRKIPIFHMEAGNRCFDQRVPEEINRKIIDHVADINLTYSNISRQYLISEGLPPDQIIKTGSPMFEVLNFYMPKIKKSKILNSLKLLKNKYFLISLHREENIDLEYNFTKIIQLIDTLSNDYDLPIIISTHPRTKKRLDLKNKKFSSKVKFMKPLGFFDYIKLQINAKTVLSDSGTITEESSILNFPALNIRETHERPEGMEEASVMMPGLEILRIKQCLKIIEKSYTTGVRSLPIVNEYNISNLSEKILRIILSYTSFVNRVVWKKHK